VYVEDRHLRGVRRRADGRDPAAANEDRFVRARRPAGPVDDTRVADQQIRCAALG
jgi:hypothetical protein